MILYKYRNNSNNTESIIRTQRVWFAKPNELNDPLECSIQTVAKNEITKALEEEEKTYYKPYNQKIRKEKRLESKNALKEIQQLIRTYGGFYKGVYLAKNLIDKNKYKVYFIPKIKYYFAQHIIENSGIFSMSEKSDIELMWSHYGDSGKGIAIGFSISETEVINSNCILLKVNYSSQDVVLRKITETTIGIVGTPKTKPIYFELPEFTDPCIKSILSSKNITWQYEHEWRLVSQFTGEGMPPMHIAEIVFGPRCPPEIEKKYIELVKKYIAYQVDFFKIQIVGRQYSRTKYIDS